MIRRLSSGRTLLILRALRATLRSRSLLRFALRSGALLHPAALSAHLRTPFLHLLVILIALVVAQDSHDLAPQFAVCAGIARAALGMRLRVLIDERLNVLLLIRREIEIAESLCPVSLHLRLARRRGAAGLRRRLVLLRLLLRARAEGRRKRRGEGGGGQEVHLHGLDTNRCRDAMPERGIRTWRAGELRPH